MDKEVSHLMCKGRLFYNVGAGTKPLLTCQPPTPQLICSIFSTESRAADQNSGFNVRNQLA